jgi:hypothetical protein
MNLKETDKVVKKETGRISVVSSAKKQATESYWQYEDFAVLQEKETAEHILSNYNRMERVDAINNANREESTPKPITKLRKLAKTLGGKDAENLNKEVERLIAEAQKKAQSA